MRESSSTVLMMSSTVAGRWVPLSSICEKKVLISPELICLYKKRLYRQLLNTFAHLGSVKVQKGLNNITINEIGCCFSFSFICKTSPGLIINITN